MTDRILEIAETAAQLSLSNRRLRLRLPDGREHLIPVAELQCLILANPAVSISGALLAALADAGCMVLVSGASRLPAAMQLPLEGNYVQTERFRAQIAAPRPLFKRLWQVIVKEKILRQGRLLEELHHDDFGLRRLVGGVGSGDPKNVEGRVARMYWNALFGKPFLREREREDNNLLLNYGYAIVRAMAARAACGAGLHPTVGIHHHNRYNSFCLADDLMEPFRPVVDRIVYRLNPENAPVPELTRELRGALLAGMLEKQRTGKGDYALAELLRISAEQVAGSLVKGEVLLKYF